jgi:hypothetical protein
MPDVDDGLGGLFDDEDDNMPDVDDDGLGDLFG